MTYRVIVYNKKQLMTYAIHDCPKQAKETMNELDKKGHFSYISIHHGKVVAPKVFQLKFKGHS